MLGSPILYIKGMRILMFQLSGFHYRFLALGFGGLGFVYQRICFLVSLLAKLSRSSVTNLFPRDPCYNYIIRYPNALVS